MPIGDQVVGGNWKVFQLVTTQNGFDRDIQPVADDPYWNLGGQGGLDERREAAIDAHGRKQRIELAKIGIHQLDLPTEALTRTDFAGFPATFQRRPIGVSVAFEQ